MSTTMTDVSKSKSDAFLQPPGYENERNSVDFGAMTPTTNGSAVSLPHYDEAVAGGLDPANLKFHPTRELQIETAGYEGLGFENQRPDPTFVYNVGKHGAENKAIYISIRFKASSNNCILVRADDPSETPVCSTKYRVGPYRPPKLTVPGFDEDVTVAGSNWNCLSRKTGFETPLGEFRWRYGGRRERHAVNASSLLVLELQTGADGPDTKDGWRRVGYMVRSKEFRSEGSSRWAAGNGGRMWLDLRDWAEKGAADQVEILAIASCMVMLKKEVENYRSAGVASYTASVA